MILHWALTECRAFGSFERYLIALSHSLAARGEQMKLVVAEGVNPLVKAAFDEAPLELVCLPLDRMEDPAALNQMVDACQPRLIHFHFVSFGHQLAKGLAALKPRIVFTDHASTTPAEQRLRGLYRGTRRFRAEQLRGIDHIIAVSDHVRQRVIAWQKAPADKITTIYNGIDLTRYQPLDDAQRSKGRRALNLPHPTRHLVGYVGQLTRDKGLHTLIHASQRLADVQGLHFMIIGDGPMAADIQAACQKQTNMSWLGARSDVPHLLPLFDLLVVPSHMQEAFGLVAAEALACGVPLLVGNVGGLPEVLGDDPNCGALTVQTSSKHLAKDIQHQISLQRTAALRLAIRARAASLFALDKQIAQTQVIYRNLLV